MTDSQNVISLKLEDKDAPLKIIKPDYSECRHLRYDIHPDLPRVFCRDCDVDLDPYWVLRRIAGDYSQRTWRIETLKRESEKLEKLIRRRLDNRKNEQLAQSDAQTADRLAATRQAKSDTFVGDVRLPERCDQ